MVCVVLFLQRCVSVANDHVVERRQNTCRFVPRIVPPGLCLAAILFSALLLLSSIASAGPSAAHSQRIWKLQDGLPEQIVQALPKRLIAISGSGPPAGWCGSTASAFSHLIARVSCLRRQQRLLPYCISRQYALDWVRGRRVDPLSGRGIPAIWHRRWVEQPLRSRSLRRSDGQSLGGHRQRPFLAARRSPETRGQRRRQLLDRSARII